MEGNYFETARRVLLERDPDLFTIDLEKHEQNMKQMRAERDAANPPRSEGPAEELRKLRGELFKLTERAKSTEVYANNKAGEVKLLLSHIEEALKQKKKAADGGNLLAERNYEHTIARLENERADAEKEFKRAQRVSAQSARELKEWPHRERVEELQKIVG